MMRNEQLRLNEDKTEILQVGPKEAHKTTLGTNLKYEHLQFKKMLYNLSITHHSNGTQCLL